MKKQHFVRRTQCNEWALKFRPSYSPFVASSYSSFPSNYILRLSWTILKNVIIFSNCHCHPLQFHCPLVIIWRRWRSAISLTTRNGRKQRRRKLRGKQFNHVFHFNGRTWSNYYRYQLHAYLLTQWKEEVLKTQSWKVCWWF